MQKDFGLSIFHAMGKILYNKRIDPISGKEQKPTFFSLDTMKDPDQRPPFYANHQNLIDEVRIDPPTFSLFLHENMPNFFSNIEDMANVMDVYSEMDAVCGDITYSYQNSNQIEQIRAQAALVETKALTEFNVHGQETEDMFGKKRGMMKFFKPAWFEVKRDKEQNLQILRETAKEGQLLQGIVSRDLIVADLQTLQSDYLSYLHKLGRLRGSLSGMRDLMISTSGLKTDL